MKTADVKTSSISEYLLKSGAVTLLFTAAGLIACAQALTFLFAGADFSSALENLRMKNAVSQWFTSIVFSLSAFLAWGISNAAVNRADKRTWQGTALFLALLSACEVVSLREFFGWSYFLTSTVSTLSAWWGALAVISVLSLWGGYGLYKALTDSPRAVQTLIFGTLLYTAGALGDAFVIVMAAARPEAGIFWPFQLVMNGAFKMLGTSVFLAGLMLHEEYLHTQIRRVLSGRHPGGLPAIKSESASWALRMIGTPTRDEILMQEETVRAAQRSRDEKQGIKAGE